MSSKAVVVALPKARRRRPVARKRRQATVPAITGRGAYKAKAPSKLDTFVPWGSMIGSGLGTLIGGPPGALIGGGLGHLAQGLVKKFTGHGDYSVEVNTLLGPRFSPPELINKAQRGVCISHREYIGEITAASTFTNRAYDINPGISTTFPWLAGVANNFEQYAFTGMVFEYKSLSADYTTAASAALGYVAMATQYNSLSPMFQDKVHMENYEFANSAKPSESFIHPIECKRALTPMEPMYVRTGPVETGADQRLYDLGKFQIATGGNSGSGVLGELWCTYEVCLYKPKLVENDDVASSAHYRLLSVNNNAPLGTSQAVQANGSTIDMTVVGTSFIFPATITDGLFLCQYVTWGNAVTIAAPTIAAASNCVLETYQKGDSVNKATVPGNGGSSAIFSITLAVRITGPSAQVSIGDDGTLPSSFSGGDLWICQINDDIQD